MDAITNSENNQVNDTDLISEEDLLLFSSENEEQIPEEMLKQFQIFQFKQFIKKRYKTGHIYGWRNEDISSAIINGLDLTDCPETRKILDNIGLGDNN